MTGDSEDLGRAWKTFSVTSVGAIVQGLAATSVVVALPTIAKDLSAPTGIAAWFILAYTLTTTVLILVFGRLADMFDRRTLYVVGLSTFALGSCVSGLAPNAAVLIAFRAVQAIGAASLMSANVAILTDAFPPRLWGLALGSHVTVSSVAQLVGPVAGGFLADVWGWRWVFLALVPVSLLGAIWGHRTLQSRRPAGPSVRFDLLGALLSVPVLGGPVLAWSLARTLTWGNLWVWGVLGVSAAAVPAFVITELRQEAPLVRLGMLRHGTTGPAYFASFLVFGVRSAIVVSMAVVLQTSLGLSALQAGLTVSALALGMMVSAPATGHLMRFLGSRLLCACGLGVALLGVLVTYWSLWTFPPEVPLPVTAIGLFAAGLGIGGFLAPNTTVIMTTVDPGERGAANGIRQTVQMTGDLFGSAVALAVIGGSALPRHTAGYHLVVAAMVGVLILAAVASLLRSGHDGSQPA